MKTLIAILLIGLPLTGGTAAQSPTLLARYDAAVKRFQTISDSLDAEAPTLRADQVREDEALSGELVKIQAVTLDERKAITEADLDSPAYRHLVALADSCDAMCMYLDCADQARQHPSEGFQRAAVEFLKAHKALKGEI